MLSRFKDFDLYRKVPKDLTESTTPSSVLSLCAALFMLILFIAELWAFLTVHWETNVVIDANADHQLRINFNITVFETPCEYLSLDIVDVLGTRNDNVTLNVNKWQVDENGMRRNYEGRNTQQQDVLHDTDLDIRLLHENGVHAVPLDANSFEPWLSRHEYTLVNFYAPWCVWCQRLHPVWEAFAERVEIDNIPVSVVTVDCVANRDLCMEQKIQAFPLLRMFKHGQVQSPDYRSDRTVDAFVEFVNSRISQDEQLSLMSPEAKAAHLERKALEKDDHPGCMLSGFLHVNKVPGNFHIQMGSKLHNINPTTANLTHMVNSLSFGPVLPKSAINRLSTIPKDYFNMQSTEPMNGNMYPALRLHQAYHHYIKIVTTNVDAGSRNNVVAYQLVQSSQIMQYQPGEVPEARFTYDLSPMAVNINRRGKHWYEFVTSMCALIGGTFTVMGLLTGVVNAIFKPKKL